jgi:hypothetical protein
MRKIYLVGAALAALALSACTEPAQDITSPDLQVAMGKSTSSYSYSNGPMWVQGEFSFAGQIESSGFEPGQNGHPQGYGDCRKSDGTISSTTSENVVWFNEQGNKTNSKFCAGDDVTGVADDVVCTIDGLNEGMGIPATYAFGGTSGPGTSPQSAQNENVNFLSDALQQAADLFVHYQAKGNKTTALGLLVVNYSCDDQSSGEAYLPLGQFAGPGNPFASTSLAGRSLNTTGVKIYSDNPAETVLGDLDSLYWTYRDRVGFPMI